jgi:hypothetical protein
MPYYDDRIQWAYASISNDKDLACTDNGKSILSEDGSAIVYVTNSKVTMTVLQHSQILCHSFKACIYATMMVKEHEI